jgi:hypothetical protein
MTRPTWEMEAARMQANEEARGMETTTAEALEETADARKPALKTFRVEAASTTPAVLELHQGDSGAMLRVVLGRGAERGPCIRLLRQLTAWLTAAEWAR